MSRNYETHPIDRVYQVRAKTSFMTFAISELWGSGDDYGSEVVFGCQLLMYTIQNDLEELQKSLEKESTQVKPKDTTNIKPLRKEA